MNIRSVIGNIVEFSFNVLISLAGQAVPGLQKEYNELEKRKQELNYYSSEDIVERKKINERQEIISNQLQVYHDENSYNQLDELVDSIKGE